MPSSTSLKILHAFGQAAVRARRVRHRWVNVRPWAPPLPAEAVRSGSTTSGFGRLETGAERFILAAQVSAHDKIREATPRTEEGPQQTFCGRRREQLPSTFMATTPRPRPGGRANPGLSCQRFRDSGSRCLLSHHMFLIARVQIRIEWAFSVSVTLRDRRGSCRLRFRCAPRALVARGPSPAELRLKTG